jgi:hypothetical protein
MYLERSIRANQSYQDCTFGSLPTEKGEFHSTVSILDLEKHVATTLDTFADEDAIIRGPGLFSILAEIDWENREDDQDGYEAYLHRQKASYEQHAPLRDLLEVV